VIRTLLKKAWIVRLAALVTATLLVAASSQAYTYYVYFNTSSAPYTPIPIRFDLSTLSNNTVPVFVSSAGPSGLYPGDSLTAIVSELTAAANVWNGVGSSAIRLEFGGFYNPGATESAPGVQIEFSDDIPPGLLAYTIPTVVGGISTPSNGAPFIPIYLSLIELPTNMSDVFTAPSYSEEFFVTLVHELGHSLGLQHTLASSVMSTYDTTASTKENPLGADDIAGISGLYPAGNFSSVTSSISGTVTMNGAGVNLASVVAISPFNPAIAALTNPDGSYQINGIPPGVYIVYVEPLPPPTEGEGSPDNIFFPKNSSGDYLPPQTGFATQFYPGTRDYTQASAVTLLPGLPYGTPINFNVTPVSSPGIATVHTWSYVQNTYLSGAPIPAGETTTLAAGGVNSSGLLQPNNSLAPGLSVNMMGPSAEVTNLRAYAPGNPDIAFDVTPTVGTGPMHLLFSIPGNVYVRPDAFRVVQSAPPLVSALGPASFQNSPAVAISGEQFTSNTQILFDGLPAQILLQTSNILLVLPPLAPAGYTASVAAFNSDGQSSLLLNAATPYTYAAGTASAIPANASVFVRPQVIPAGSPLTVTVEGTNTNFVAGVTTVGFGTSDVTVGQVNVIDATHLSATVTPNVSVSSMNITVTTGLEVISQALGSQITAAP
jgi:hypothetical protein